MKNYLNSIIYRIAISHDIPKLNQVNRICMDINYDKKEWDILMSGMYNGVSFVAEYKNKIIGYIILTLNLIIKNEITITSLAVLPEYRRNSIAKMLLIKSMVANKKKYAFQYTGLNLHVQPDSHAQQLYFKMKFKIQLNDKTTKYGNFMVWKFQ